MSIPPPLVPEQVQLALCALTRALIGLAIDDYKSVVPGWRQEGQPAQPIGTTVAYVIAAEDDDDVNRMRDQTYVENAEDPDFVDQIDTYTRVWRGSWTFMGPLSNEWARKLRSGFYSQVPHDMFVAQNLALYPVMDLRAPTRIREAMDGQWWERVDFEMQFNELTTELVEVGTVASTEVKVYTERAADINHPDRDITVTT